MTSTEESVDEAEEPGVVLVAPEGGEPHLPVQARLVRQDVLWGRGDVPGLVEEVVLPPRSVDTVRPLQDNLRPAANPGHAPGGEVRGGT